MKYKLKNGIEVDLHDEDIMAISKMHGDDFDFEDMKEYFEELHKHAISKLEHISEMIITDEDSIDMAAVNVMKNGTYMDFAKFMRYSRDYDISKHLLESAK
jgi:uncharacterized protein YbaP (TraB family)